ncbi:Glycoprotein-N-acetylgalactosamine 3-beta-galactosyltransferase 1 [Portunus trituberculatus]|uniref:N-acetylgalactosaminide beta-1,3-galactosyltransferase n=1 Tax=Portunus trituberculatus TaxID=210409 RepID=A0A5B7CHX9_PORTR|nr:Glycoprotein-N-acetylgalactosamine 3-beta-galactosyltransferase 1 [Portunus trituberculatus]
MLLNANSSLDTELGAIDLGVGDGRDHLWGKTKAAFKYLYDHHLNDYDWFFKADDDTYTIMENMRYMLSTYDSSLPIYFGSRFKKFTKQGYMSGGKSLSPLLSLVP